MGKFAYYRPDISHYTRSSRSFYNTLRYYFCTSTDIYFKKKEKYEKHSKNLVNALKEWINSISFPVCNYIDGVLKFYDYTTNDEIPLLKQAKDHLDKSYPHIINMHNDTIKDCNKLCRKIKGIINVENKSSFENIIVTRIISACPQLKITQII